MLSDLLNLVGIPCTGSTRELPAGALDELEQSLDRFSEVSQRALTDEDRRLIRNFELETARAAVVGCGARLVYPVKGCSSRYHAACGNETVTSPCALLRLWVDSKREENTQ